MAKNNLRDRAYDARMALEQAGMRLAGVQAAHYILHNDSQSDAPLTPELLYPLLLVLDDALEQIRTAIEGADLVLTEVHRSGGRDAE